MFYCEGKIYVGTEKLACEQVPSEGKKNIGKLTRGGRDFSDPTRPDPTRHDTTRPDPTRPDPTRLAGFDLSILFFALVVLLPRRLLFRSRRKRVRRLFENEWLCFMIAGVVT